MIDDIQVDTSWGNLSWVRPVQPRHAVSVRPGDSHQGVDPGGGPRHPGQ